MSDKLRASFDRLREKAPRAVAVDAANPVRFVPLAAESDLPVLATPEVAGVDLRGWAAGARDQIDQQLARSGAVLFRGFNVSSAEELEAFSAALAPELLGYGERSTPRRQVGGKVYTSTEYPADQPIPMHNELSYAASWPERIWFYCHVEPTQGGATPIADAAAVYRELDPEVRERFVARRVLYVRNFGAGLGLTWQEVFQTNERGAVESYCRAAGIDWEWRADGRLTTRSVRPATLCHPRRGEEVWFNQAHLHHVSALPAEARAALLEVVAPDEMPFNTYYGDGSEIEPAALDEVRRAYEACTIRFAWQRGDVLMLDNLRVAHGRDPFAGERKILVTMA